LQVYETEIDMWTVVYIAQSRNIALSAQQLLESNGIISMLRFLCDGAKSSGCYELLVPEAEVQQGLSLIIDKDF
jgi:hypothetical protein